MSTFLPADFHAEAAFQRVCAVCSSASPWEAHHVVAKQRLKAKGLGDKLYDPRNALRLCKRCHAGYTGRSLVIETSELRYENICFLWETLGVAGQNYLERHYTGVDRRYTLHPEGKCPRCQN